MNVHSCIIIEDEPLAMERTKKFIDKTTFLDLKGTFDNALDGLSYLNSESVDVLFLDINMDELTGIELLEHSNIDSEIIITTAYQEYALKGYELNITDYLLKPFTFQRFLQAASKAQKKLSLKHSANAQDFIFVKTENRLVKISFDDIVFIEGMRDYRRIHTKGKSIMTLQKFSELEQIIPKEKVCRVHKSYMVSLSKITDIERNRIRILDKVIPISATYKATFFDLIQK